MSEKEALVQDFRGGADADEDLEVEIVIVNRVSLRDLVDVYVNGGEGAISTDGEVEVEEITVANHCDDKVAEQKPYKARPDIPTRAGGHKPIAGPLGHLP